MAQAPDGPLTFRWRACAELVRNFAHPGPEFRYFVARRAGWRWVVEGYCPDRAAHQAGLWRVIGTHLATGKTIDSTALRVGFRTHEAAKAWTEDFAQLPPWAQDGRAVAGAR